MSDSGPMPAARVSRGRRLLVGSVAVIWLVAAALGVWLFLLSVEDSAAASPDLVAVAQVDPFDLLADPSLLLREPGVIGLAIQMEAGRIVGACMRAAGFAYDGVPGIDRVAGFDLLVATGYGIGQGLTLDAELADLGYLERLDRNALDDYEAALYGGPLRDLVDGALPGGCARAGLEAVLGAVRDLQTLDPTLEDLWETVVGDGRWQAAGDGWLGCMAARAGELGGLFAREPPLPLVPFAPDFRDPDGFVGFLIRALDSPPGRALAGVETLLAGADAECREAFTTRTAEDLVVALAGSFVDGNSSRLRTILGAAGG